MNNVNIKNALSVDVEDYFQVAAFAKTVSMKKWDSYESRVSRNTNELLDLFDKNNIKSTFFVLGWVAERHPELVREIAKRGHEVASHGYSHQLIYKQTPAVFREETRRSKEILESLIQDEVLGYRAASYSITNESIWALDILAETGFKYDSSIFPIRHDRYGIPGARTEPHILKTESGNTLVEYPLTTKQIFGYKLPAAGGGYFRLYPYFLTRYLLSSIEKETTKPFIFYLHPWEIDPGQPRIDASLLSRFRHYNNLDQCKNRLKKLLADFNFTTVRAVLSELQLI